MAPTDRSRCQKFGSNGAAPSTVLLSPTSASKFDCLTVTRHTDDESVASRRAAGGLGAVRGEEMRDDC